MGRHAGTDDRPTPHRVSGAICLDHEHRHHLGRLAAVGGQRTGSSLLLALAEHSDNDGRAWPSVARLARYTLMDVRNVHRALVRLVEQGEIVAAGRGKRGVVVYRLTPGGSRPEPLAKSPEVEIVL